MNSLERSTRSSALVVKRPFKDITHDLKGVVADMAIAKSHPRSLERPQRDDGMTAWVAHGLHKGAHLLGQRLNRDIERKTPTWPLDGIGERQVLGYGSEKIAYLLPQAEGPDAVLSIFHSTTLLGRDPGQAAAVKKNRYDTYKNYFGSLVVPTVFLIVDNPWGKGSKPASLQYHFGQTQEIGDFSRKDLIDKTTTSPDFASSLHALVDGYNAMKEEGFCPDFAASNILIRDDEILLPDTGYIYEASMLPKLSRLHETFGLLESLQGDF